MTKEPNHAALFEASPYPYLLIAPDLTLIGANAAYLKATGASAEAILGRHIFDAFPANPGEPESTDLDQVRRSIEGAISTRMPHTSMLLRYAVPRQLPEGTVFEHRLWSAVHTPVLDEHGEVAFVAQNAIDVTDLYRFDAPANAYFMKQSVNALPDIPGRSRPQLHEALARILNAERTLLQTLFDRAPGFIAVLTGAGHVFEMANDAFCQLVGQRELIGKTLSETLPELAGQGFGQTLAEVFRSGRTVVLRNQTLAVRDRLDGPLSRRYVDLMFQPVMDADGSVSAIFAQGHDVTGAHLAGTALEEKVRQLEEARARQAMLLKLGDRLRSLSDDPEAMMGAASRALAAFLDVPRAGYVTFEESTGQAIVVNTYADLGRVPPLPEVVEQPDEYGKSVMNALRSGRHIAIDDLETDPRTAGAVAQAHAAIGARASLAVPIQRQGRSIAFMFAHDDKPRTWSEDDAELMYQTADRTWEAVERARTLLALRDTDRRKDEFLAMLAHELRNPLAPIGAAAELLQLASLDEARLRQTSEVIGRQVRHMTSLIDDLLDVSRVTRGLVGLDNARLDLGDVVADAVEQVNPLIRARGHHLALHLAPEASIVEGDRKRLVQVIANILNNAAKYTHDGGHIALHTSVTDQHVVIAVSDDGIGMTADLAKRVFDLFAQAERTSDRSSGGLGLGLALVKSLVELDGGAVTCTSGGPGKGSTFRVCLPRLQEAAPARARPAPRGEAQSPAGSLRILVVDDNTDAAAMLAMLLETLGHEVLVEHGSHRALQRAREDKPQVCLLDIGLPGMDGIELAKCLRSMPETRDAVLIAATGYGQRNDHETALAAGFDHHLVKPVDIQKLAAILAGIGAQAGMASGAAAGAGDDEAGLPVPSGSGQPVGHKAPLGLGKSGRST